MLLCARFDFIWPSGSGQKCKKVSYKLRFSTKNFGTLIYDGKTVTIPKTMTLYQKLKLAIFYDSLFLSKDYLGSHDPTFKIYNLHQSAYCTTLQVKQSEILG